MMNQHNRIPSLDGLRCIAVSLVLFSHLLGTRGFFSPPKTSFLYAFGNLGVQVFFVISGYLITHLLLSELQRSDKIHLGTFYFRRTLRIFPPCYFMIGGLVLLTAAGWNALTPKDAFHALTYTSNYYPGRSWNIGHTWSLGVEEQFYLLWPAVLVILGRRKGFFVAASVIFICPIIRVLLWHFYRLPDIGHRFETVADAIATGCLLAGTREWLHRQQLYKTILGSKFLFALPIFVLAALILDPHPMTYFAVSPTVMNLSIALFLDFSITYHRGADSAAVQDLQKYSFFGEPHRRTNEIGGTSCRAFQTGGGDVRQYSAPQQLLFNPREVTAGVRPQREELIMDLRIAVYEQC